MLGLRVLGGPMVLDSDGQPVRLRPLERVVILALQNAAIEFATDHAIDVIPRVIANITAAGSQGASQPE
jgi:hypothetical protein